MAVAHRASATHNETNPTSSCTVTIPGTVATEDLLYLSVVCATTTLPVVTDDDSGGNLWTNIATTTNNTGSLFYKRATSGTASKTVTVTETVFPATAVSAGLSAYSGGITGATPHTDVISENNTSGNETHDGFDPDVADCMICFSVMNTQAVTAVTSVACTDPGALTQRFEKDSAAGAGLSVTHWSALQSAGPTSTGDFTWAQTNHATKSIAWAIKPPGGSVAGRGLTKSVLLERRRLVS